MRCAQPNAQRLAYQQIIDEADVLLTVYDTAAPHDGRAEDQALFYAANGGKPMWNLEPHTL